VDGLFSFSRREKVPAKRADEGVPTAASLRELSMTGSPSPVASGDTLSLRERGDLDVPLR
jgi:hypothetical protein